MYQNKNGAHTPTHSFYKGHAFKKDDSLQLTNFGDQSPSSSKNDVWAYRPLQPDVCTPPKQFQANKVVVKCNFKTMDWQLVSPNMSISHPNPNTIFKKKETPTNNARKEMNNTIYPKGPETQDRSSPVNQEYDSMGRRPITVILGNLKNKSEARSKAPKIFYEPAKVLNIAGHGVKKGQLKDDFDEMEASKRLGYSLTPSVRVGSSMGVKGRSENIGEIKEKNNGDMEEKGEEKLVQEVTKRSEVGTAEKGFRMRKWINESSSNLGVGLSPANKIKSSQTSLHKIEESPGKGITMSVKGEEEMRGLARDDSMKGLKGYMKVPLGEESEKVISLRSEESEGKNFQAMTPGGKVRSYRLERILNGESKGLHKRNTIKLDGDVSGQERGEMLMSRQIQQGEEGDETVEVGEKEAKKNASLSAKITKKAEGPSPREASRAVKRYVYRPALEELLGQEKDSQVMGKSCEVQREKTGRGANEEDPYGQMRPETGTKGDVLNVWNKQGSNEKSGKMGGQQKMVNSMSVMLKPAVEQVQEIVEPLKVTTPASRQGLSLSRIPIGKVGFGGGERSNERNVMNRKESVGNFGEKHSKRNRVVIVEEINHSGQKEEAMNFLERKLFGQGGKGDVIEGWDLGVNESEPDSPLVFSPWGKKKV